MFHCSSSSDNVPLLLSFLILRETTVCQHYYLHHSFIIIIFICIPILGTCIFVRLSRKLEWMCVRMKLTVGVFFCNSIDHAVIVCVQARQKNSNVIQWNLGTRNWWLYKTDCRLWQSVWQATCCRWSETNCRIRQMAVKES
jgi:hypothetical protein